jgi:hypothetical protein
MKANQATFPVRVMSRLLGVSASGFYAWVNRSASARAVEDIGLTALIHAIHRRSGGAYTAPRAFRRNWPMTTSVGSARSVWLG